MKRFFDIRIEKFLDLNSEDIQKIDGGKGLKIKNKWYNCLYDRQEEIYYIFDISKTQKDLNMDIDPENKYVIKATLNNEIESDTHGVKNVYPFPKNNELNIGDKCSVGALVNCLVMDKDDRGYYYIKYYQPEWNIKKNPELANKPSYSVYHWRHVFPILENQSVIEFTKSNTSYFNQCLESLISKYFVFGIDMNPEYQRGLVWTEEQKVKLIDSIFNNVSIGAFVLAEKKWFTDGNVVSEMYEIVDGKQRLTAIIDFVSSKFPYKGKYYHELAPITRHEFEDQQVLIGMLNLNRVDAKYNRKQVIEQFIRLNENGTIVDKNIINKAKELIK